MEIWHYIESLNRTGTPTEQKISQLQLISSEGNSSHIFYLLNLLCDKKKEVRDQACATIIALFHKIRNKNGYYHSLRYCDISKSDLAFFASAFPLDQYVELLAISSLNGSGHLREYAVEKLSEIAHPRAIPFIIYRLADWVYHVRQAAKQVLEHYLVSEYLDDLVENLPLFAWLKTVKRVNLQDVYDAVIRYVATENRPLILERFDRYPEKSRLIIAEHLSGSWINTEAELKKLVADPYFRIRMLAANHPDKLSQQDLNRLLNDKSSKVRLQTLYALKDRSGIQTIVLGHLADESSSIRYFARYTLKHSGIDFASFYHQNLEQGNQIGGSLAGLAELDAKHFSGTMKKYLENQKVKIRVGAFLALRKLDQQSVSVFALENLGVASGKLRNAIIEHLSFIPRKDVLEKARNLYQHGDYELKKSMLLLFSKMSSWSILADLMLGTVDEDERLRKLSQQFIETWKKKATTLYTTPSEEDLERARKTHAFASELHEKNRYFKRNPLEGMDFYLH